jgi:surface polysaccharide O-acyltransferase-like enzyme
VFDEPHLREPLLSVISLFLIAGLFAMALFFFIAGIYTAPSLARKDTTRFVIDRALRLGIPMLFFIVLMSPVIEYVDPDNAAWTDGFWAFAVDIWWPPAPGPTWFLGVLLFLSVVYALIRKVMPRPDKESLPLRIRHLVLVASAVTVVSYLIRMAVPLGEEVWRLSVGQAPGWIAGFALGVLAAERDALRPLAPRLVVVTRRTAWAALAGGALTLMAMQFGLDGERLFGGGSWESLWFAAIEGVLVVSIPFWLVDLFRRRFPNQGSLAREMSRAAFAAFLFHQLILVGLVLASRSTTWPPEIDYLVVSALGVAGSFLVGSLVLRVPGISKIL